MGHECPNNRTVVPIKPAQAACILTAFCDKTLSYSAVKELRSEPSMPLILIADDDPAYRTFIRKTLTNPAYIFVEAKDGQQALAAAREYHPELAILDILMPLIDGFQLCRLVKADPDLRTTRLLVLTVLSSTADQTSGVDAGCDAYLVKRCSVDRLRATVAHLLSSRVQ